MLFNSSTVLVLKTHTKMSSFHRIMHSEIACNGLLHSYTCDLFSTNTICALCSIQIELLEKFILRTSNGYVEYNIVFLKIGFQTSRR